MNLRDLDERLVPAMAEWLDRVVKRLPTPPEPSGPAPLIVRLRRVDDRWTRRGPLALIRDVPQVGAVVVFALLLAGAATVKLRHDPRAAANGGPVPSASASADPEEDDGILGPQIGEKVPLYLAESRQKLERIGAGQPDGVVMAVISFRTYQTPVQAAELLGPIPVKRVFYRPALPLNQVQAASVAVEDLVRDSRKAFTRVAAQLARDAAELRKVAATIENDPAQKAEHERDAVISSRQAAILRGPCDCVFAVVVRTKLRLLLDLVGNPAVRVIEPSVPGAKPEDFDYFGLLPEEKVTVTAGNQAG
jgi:hypothetical protein